MSIGGLRYRLNDLQKSAAILTFAGVLQFIHHYYYRLFLIQSLFRLSAFNFFYLLTIGKQMYVRIELLEYHFPLQGLIVVLFMKGLLQLANRVSIPHLVF